MRTNRRAWSGIWKLLVGIVLVIAGTLFSLRGCQEVQESLIDQEGNTFQDSDGNEVEF